MCSLQPSPKAAAWDCLSAAPLSSRTVAVCGLPTTLRAAQDFVSHYLSTASLTTPLRRNIALDLLTAARPTTRSFKSTNIGHPTSSSTDTYRSQVRPTGNRTLTSRTYDFGSPHVLFLRKETAANGLCRRRPSFSVNKDLRT